MWSTCCMWSRKLQNGGNYLCTLVIMFWITVYHVRSQSSSIAKILLLKDWFSLSSQEKGVRVSQHLPLSFVRRHLFTIDFFLFCFVSPSLVNCQKPHLGKGEEKDVSKQLGYVFFISRRQLRNSTWVVEDFISVRTPWRSNSPLVFQSNENPSLSRLSSLLSLSLKIIRFLWLFYLYGRV